jgi:putative SOS response-associated peptidase YedK
MCGRFVGHYSTIELLDEINEAILSSGHVLHVPDITSSLAQNFNTAPTHGVPVLRVIDNRVEIDVMQWGLVPVWSKDPTVGSKMINARSETLTEKPSFKGLVQKNRCIIPMNGFYEWDRSDQKRKVPYFVPRADGHLMLTAGLWTSSPALEGRHTFSLITRESIEDLSHIHSRSPVEFDALDAVAWMTETPAPLHMFDPTNQPRFAPYRVSSRVNSVRNNDDALIAPDNGSEEEVQDTLF